jgi:CheY-like chemotaxis protein
LRALKFAGILISRSGGEAGEMNREDKALMAPRVLVIDDETVLVSLLETVLEVLGCEKVVPAGSLSEGLQCAQEGEFDLILLDNHFPEGHSDDIVEPLCEANPDTPILIITGNRNEHVERSLQLGASGGLEKPFGLQKLSDALRRYCSCTDTPAEVAA